MAYIRDLTVFVQKGSSDPPHYSDKTFLTYLAAHLSVKVSIKLVVCVF